MGKNYYMYYLPSTSIEHYVHHFFNNKTIEKGTPGNVFNVLLNYRSLTKIIKLGIE